MTYNFFITFLPKYIYLSFILCCFFFSDKPSKPVGPIEFSDVDKSSVTLSWKPPSSDGGKPIEKYIIEHRDLRRSTWVKAGSVQGDSTTFTAENLTEGNSYTFRVTAVNEEGESQPLESADTVKPQRSASMFCLFYLLKILPRFNVTWYIKSFSL